MTYRLNAFFDAMYEAPFKKMDSVRLRCMLVVKCPIDGKTSLVAPFVLSDRRTNGNELFP